MAKIDEIKEEISYLKFWLGIIVVTNIGLISWLVKNYNQSFYKTIADIASIFILSVTIIIINKRIKSKIKKLGDI